MIWFRVCFHYEREMQYSLFLLLIFLLCLTLFAVLFPQQALNGAFFVSFMIFPRLKSKRVLSKAKKSIKQTNNTPFLACSGNEPLSVERSKNINKTNKECYIPCS